MSSYRRIKHVDVNEYTGFVMRLLDNPGEIWWHAYDQQISNSARSVLLVLHSMNGKCSFDRLEKAYVALDAHRGQKYGYAIRPGSWRSALRELTDAFVSSTGSGLTFINPSVGDLMNKVLNSEPENAVDIVSAATEFQQYQRVCTIARSSDANELHSYLNSNAQKLAPSIEILAGLNQSYKYETSELWFTQSLDYRVATLLEFADSSQSPAILKIAVDLMGKEMAEDDSMDVDPRLKILNIIENAGWEKIQNLYNLHSALKAKMLNPDTSHAWSAEIFSIAEYSIDNLLWSDADEKSFEALCEYYFSDCFTDELSGCSEIQEFESLAQTVQEIGEANGWDVSAELSSIHEPLDEMTRQEEMRADATQGEWRGGGQWW